MELRKTDELLGEGHYGKVYKATDPNYVVKVIQNTRKSIASAQAECLIHQSLENVSHNHACIPTVVPLALRDQEVIITASHPTDICLHDLDTPYYRFFRYTHFHAT
jgi:serine/threonine protein kinase